MTQLNLLQSFETIVNQLQQSLQTYNENIRNETFEIEPNHSYGKALQDEVNNMDASKYINQIVSSFEMPAFSKISNTIDGSGFTGMPSC